MLGGGFIGGCCGLDIGSLIVGGEPVAEAKGLEEVLSGARERIADDDALLAGMSNVLDSFYTHFERESRRTKDSGSFR